MWIVLFDGEEAVKEWTQPTALYGSRHLAQKWQQEGVLPKIKALLLLDMIGDADLDIQRDTNSTSWLEDMVQQAALEARLWRRTFSPPDVRSKTITCRS